MKSREETVIKELKLTHEQMVAAMKRACENAKHWPVWNDPKANTTEGKQ